jgi:hypothetical protein
MTKYYATVSVENISKLIRCLERANQEARDLNSQFDMRVRLWNTGLFADRMALPSLIEIETRAFAAILTVRFRMHFNPRQNQPEENETVLFS